MATTEDIRRIVSGLAARSALAVASDDGERMVQRAVDEAVKAIGDLIVDAQASESKLVHESYQRILATKARIEPRGSVWD